MDDQTTGVEIAAALEALAQIAPPAPVHLLREHTAASKLAEARTCYDHLAGRRGVELRDHLLAAGAVRPVDDRDHIITRHGRALLLALDIDPGRLEASRRVLARSCIDWTQRLPHLAGSMPAALTARFLELGWVSRSQGRGLRLAEDYDQRLANWLHTSAS